jgi:hypothetical protein
MSGWRASIEYPFLAIFFAESRSNDRKLIKKHTNTKRLGQ